MANALRFLLTPNSSPAESNHAAFPAPLPFPLNLLPSLSSLTSISIPFTTPSTSLPRASPFPPSTLSTTPLASPTLPTITNHRGVSGMTAITPPCTTAGSAPSPTIHRHAVAASPNSPSPHPTTYATTWPSVIKTTFIVTNLPLHPAGATSAIYNGTTKLAAPTAIPTTARPTTITATELLHACTSAPSAKSASARSTTRLRPRRSASTDEKGDTSSASKEVELVMTDLSSAVRGREERDVLMETRVEEITPVSSAV